MDKSFNDEELSDIMKEIEALEEDFKTDDIGDEKIEATSIMEEFAQLDEEVALPTPAARVEQSTVLPMTAKSTSAPSAAPAASTSAPASMSFKVSGDINLELQFDIGGKVVNLNVTESGLNIEMEGGMSFKVPLSNTAHKKAA
jgi:hypothetical protein